ncbi:MAG: sulfite exporter TauE/SafE family protein [Armatimonadetes bacterium]|nr:MAG: sulfite exporter TauE/SafE family protein [Armatimonadota bacterium]
MDLAAVFITGLTVGGLSCMAVQGGLLAGVIASQENEESGKGKSSRLLVIPTLSFLSAKLVAHTLLGFMLGSFGSVLSLSGAVGTIVQFIAAFYMVAIALNLLNVHPIFRYVIIQPPKIITRKIKNSSKSKSIFAPAVLGLMTIFLPCGTTLAMEALAVSSGSALAGALIMMFFVLGTAPFFLGLGFITAALGETFHRQFLKLAAVAVLYFGLTSFNGALTAVNAPLTVAKFQEYIPFEIVWGEEKPVDPAVKIVNGVQQANIDISSRGYSPTRIRVRSGMPVKLTLSSYESYGCAAVFTIPELGIKALVPRNGETSVDFTPVGNGKIMWSCSMGMYSGVIEVI